MTSRRSSGSIRAESAVEPTRSENITVTWRRSAVSVAASSVARGTSDSVAGAKLRTGSRSLFDHLVRASEQRGGHLKAELPCSFLVYDQLKFGGRLNRQFGRIGTAQDLINIGCCACDVLV